MSTKLLRITLFLCLLSLPVNGFSQSIEMPNQVKVGHLKNGMTYFLIPDGNPGKVKLTMLTKVGAFLETPNQHGYAHMVEHMLFKGSANYPGRACLDELELMGMRRGVDTNGYTGPISTQYFVTIPENDKDYFERSLSLLRDWMFYLEMDEGVLENEKKVITEEINRAGGDPIGNPNLIGTSLEGHDPLGSKASVKSATSSGLYQFYKDNYVPSNMALIIHGQMDQKWAEKQIKSTFSKETAAKGHKPNHYININSETIVSGNYGKKKDSDPDALVLLFKEKPIDVVDYMTFKENIKRKLMTQMLDRRFVQLMGKSVKRISVNKGSVIPGNSVYNFRFELSKNASYKMVFSSLCEVLAQVQQHGFTTEELNWVNAMETLYQERRRKLSPNLANAIQNYFISGDMPIEADQYEEWTLKIIKELTTQDYLDLFNHMLDLEKTILYDSTSIAWSHDFNKTTILEQLVHLDTIPTSDFVFEGKVPMAKQSSEPLSFELNTPCKTAVKKEKPLAEGLKVLTYPSGLKVVLYNSNEEKASVKMLSPKGLSFIPVEDRSSFEKSIRYMNTAYGKYHEEEARAIERSMTITKRASIDDYFYELNINGQSVYWEELLKCFNLLITETVYQDTSKVINALERRSKRGVDENTEFNEALVERLYKYDNNIKSAIGEAIVLVQGNLPENIENLVSQYIGSLPSKESGERFTANVDEIIPDSVVFTNVPWKKDLSKMAWYFRQASKKELTLHDELVLRGATEYAHLMMFRVIREKYGMVYATGKNADVYKVPFDYSTLRLAFMTDTSNIARARKIMTGEVLKPLSKAVLTDTEVEKTKALVRSLYVMSFFEDQRIGEEWLKACLKYGKVYSLKELEVSIEAITQEEIESWLHRMIDLDHYELKIHRPEMKD